MKKIIAYYRVSTKKQAASGLGLEAQKAAVATFAKQNGCTIDKEYEEQESGRKSSRLELRRAINRARATGHTLVVAKLDRLSRSVAFTSALMESGVDFVCCDNPKANKLTIHILAAMAQYEQESAKQRTKEAIAARKRRHERVTPGLTAAGRQKGAKIGQPIATEVAAAKRNQRRNEHYAITLEGINLKAMAKTMSYAEIAAELTRLGHTTVKGQKFTPMAVWRLLKKLPTAPFAF